MQIANPFQLNDWQNKKFLAVVLTIQAVMFALIGLELLGLNVPFLRQLVGCVYLLFIPGAIILRLLKAHGLHPVESLLYSIGMSIAFVMFLGFAINSLYPHLGISQPLSSLPLLTTFGIVVLALSLISCRRDTSPTHTTALDLKLLISPPFLFLVFLVMFTAVGALQITYGNSATLLLVLIPLVALIPILVAFKRFIPQELYSFAIVAISLTILFQASLMSPYLTHQDIHREFHATSLVLQNSIWDSNLYIESENGLLSITMLPVICSIFLRMDVVWIFKIIYPLIFALVPLGLFQIFRKQGLPSSLSFLAAFFFISFTDMFIRMAGLPRQEIAELFLVLVFLLLSAKEIRNVAKIALALVFVASIVVSHYGIAYALIVYTLVGWLGLTLVRNYPGWLAKLGIFRAETKPSSKVKTNDPASTILTATFAIFCIVVTLTWFMNVTQGLGFLNLIRLSMDLYHSILTDLLNMAARDAMVPLALGGAPTTPTIWREIHRFVQYATQILIVLGVLYMVFKWREGKFERHFAIMALASAFVLVMSIVVPRFSVRISLIRVYHIALLFLAPFCALGIDAIINWICRLTRHRVFRPPNSLLYQRLFLIVLIPYFLFNIGFIYELAHDPPMENPVRMLTMKNYPRLHSEVAFYNTYTPEQDVFCARWFSKARVKGPTVYADCNSYPHVLASYGMVDIHVEARLLTANQQWGLHPFTHIWSDDLYRVHYIYLGYFNVVVGKFPIYPPGGIDFVTFSLSDLSDVFVNRAKIYSNGGSEIYYGRRE